MFAGDLQGDFLNPQSLTISSFGSFLGTFFYVGANVLFVVVVKDVKLSGIWILLPTMWTAVAAPTGHIT